MNTCYLCQKEKPGLSYDWLCTECNGEAVMNNDIKQAIIIAKTMLVISSFSLTFIVVMIWFIDFYISWLETLRGEI